MTNTTKFTFETIFDQSGEVVSEAPKPQKRSYLPKEVEKIRTQAMQEGTRSAQAMADQAIASSLKQMSAVIESLFNILEQEVEVVKSEAAQLAYAIGSKIGGKLIDEAPTQALEELIEECLGNLRSEPHVHIQVHPDNADILATRIGETIAGRSFEGKLHITPSDGLGETDVKIEWANGGIEKSQSGVIEAITKIVEEKWNISVRPEPGVQEDIVPSGQLADIA
jgi:flagellar assembly protein FliH